MDEVETYARILKVKRHLLNNMATPGNSVMVYELEKVLHNMADSYEDRTDKCLLSLALNHPALKSA